MPILALLYTYDNFGLPYWHGVERWMMTIQSEVATLVSLCISMCVRMYMCMPAFFAHYPALTLRPTFPEPLVA